MRLVPTILACGIGVIALGCAREPQTEIAADTASLADSLAMGTPAAGTPPAAPVAAADRTAEGPGMPVTPVAQARPAVAQETVRTMRAGAVMAVRENVVEVREDVRGLLEQAKYHPLDAQHIAQTRHPKGVVEDGVIERRPRGLVYVFTIREEGKLHEVVVDAIEGFLLSSTPKKDGKP